jgi:hypothetical protein
MRLAVFVLPLSLLALPAFAADEAALAAQHGLTGLREIKAEFPSAQLADFAPGVMDAAIISRAGFGGHGSIFVQAGTKSNVCTASRGSDKWDCEQWGVVAIRTDTGFSDVITTDNQNAALFVRALLDGKPQTLLLMAKRADVPSQRPAPVTFTAYALHVDYGIDTEDISFQPVKSWAGAGSYCHAHAAFWALLGERRNDVC